MHMKKWISGMTALAMAACLLAGCGSDGSESETRVETTAETQTEWAENLSAFDGWWTISPNYYEGVIPILTTFHVDTASQTWTIYDSLGNPGDTMPCSFPEDGVIVLDMNGLGSQEMALEDGILYYIDDDHEAYIHVENPEFVQIGSFAGTWLEANDPETGIYYELTEDRAVKYDCGTVLLDTSYQPAVRGSVIYQNDTRVEGNMPYLELDDGSTALFPSDDEQVLVEQGTFRNTVYVKEGASVPLTLAPYLDALVNGSFYLEPETAEAGYHQLTFDPGFTFCIMHCLVNGENFDVAPGSIAGTWDLGSDLILRLQYTGGSTEEIDMNDWDGTLPFAALEQTFILDDGYFG